MDRDKIAHLLTASDISDLPEVADYPRQQKRNFRIHQKRQIVDWENITKA